MAFNRPANNKQLSFNEVSLKTKLPEDEIELLVMRALSLGLVKGSIDQIDKNIFISWVQPRVLDINQVRIYFLTFLEELEISLRFTRRFVMILKLGFN
jgi:26S proteasome regulatory subunit N9